jgi:uncharacterized protein (TIGR01777 family)
MGKIIIAGGTGLIGSALATDLAAIGHEIILLSRNPSKRPALPAITRALAWDGSTATGWGAEADGATAIVNLAGATISRPPWTEGYKRRILASRVNAGKAVVEAVSAAARKPGVVIQSSGVGYYGLHGDEVVTEETPAGTDFLARVCVEWEASTAAVEAQGTRQVVTRSGLVLSIKGGVLPVIALPFRFFVGGPVGSGRQYMPWIHIADEVAAVRFLIEHDTARGPFNLTAPHPETNKDLGKLLGRVLHRPSFVPTPGMPFKIMLGEMADLLLLGGQRAIPARLQQLGFQFRFPDTEPALRDLYRSSNDPTSAAAYRDFRPPESRECDLRPSRSLRRIQPKCRRAR